MKRAFLASTAFFFGGLCVQCPQASKREHVRMNSMNQAGAALTHAGASSHELEMTKEAKQLMLLKLKDDSLKLGLENLREADTNGETEIRIWVGVGIMYPRCFILKTFYGKRTAYYVTPKASGGEAAKDSGGQELSERDALNDPPSGWSELEGFLKEQGIDVPMKLSLDEKYTPEVDGGLIAVEAKSPATYNMVFYYLNTKSDDGQKALKVCRRIEQEFPISMGCSKVN